MVRFVAAAVLVSLLTPAAQVFAGEPPAGAGPTAPSAAVAAAWAKETKARNGRTLNALVASYGVMQGLDMASTIAARQRGAVEANPAMQGSYAQGMAVKAALSAASMLAVHEIAKKNKKAAVLTVIAMDVATGMVVVNNARNAHRLAR